MTKATIRIEKLVIPTYFEAPREDLPIFCENRVHQRSSGRVYPNKVNLSVDHTQKKDKEYTAVYLENEYLKVCVLPEIGGKIYSAEDKKTGYSLFYKQHVIKPALIGALGSWTSGGLEFNWPFHHRPSGFMHTDFTTETSSDGSVVCWLSEHDPVDRMKCLIGIILRPGTAIIETKKKVCNRTPTTKSFLWWENAAVPVNPSYQLFFPRDVSYVNFHYLDSRISYPIAGDNVFNGIAMTEPRDISQHKNTQKATSYFACASRYDFFGGYDHDADCGVVHIGDHHISPGKKMFTWGYEQLSKTWETALTDTDGQYVELMAGTYSDNQPNFAWLEPYETKEFSNFWYPITKIGTPDYADQNIAIKLQDDAIALQSTLPIPNANILVTAGGVSTAFQAELSPCEPVSLPWKRPQALASITVRDEKGQLVAHYGEQVYDTLAMPEVKKPMPFAADMPSADQLYLAGTHVEQYRDPAVMPDAYWLEALKRNPAHIPSLLGMAKYSYTMYRFEDAKKYVQRAIAELNTYNERHQTGDAYYLQGLVLEALGEISPAYDAYQKAAWNGSAVSKSMARIACLDIKNGQYEAAIQHANVAMAYHATHPLASAALLVAHRKTGNTAAATYIAEKSLQKDPLNMLIRFLSEGCTDCFFEHLRCNPAQMVLDISSDLALMGQYDTIVQLLQAFSAQRPDQTSSILLYTLAYYLHLSGNDCAAVLQQADTTDTGPTFPFRQDERLILQFAADHHSTEARFLLGCLLYDKRHYHKAAQLFEQVLQTNPNHYMASRSLAIAYFSHLDKPQEALALMKKAVTLCGSEQMVYDLVILMDRLSIPPHEKLAFLRQNTDTIVYDNLVVEMAKAYNQSKKPEDALHTLLSHAFVPFEGGEHSVATQYMYAHYLLGMEQLQRNEVTKALAFFEKALTLPDSLGAGIWNECVYYPYYMRMAECYDRLGQHEKAAALYTQVLNTKIEFFSNMHLKELPYYQAVAAKKLGLDNRAQNIMTDAKRKWTAELNKVDNGFFETTPFFISFVDSPAKLRRAQYLYLLALVELYRDNVQQASLMFAESHQLNQDNLFCGFYANDTNHSLS